MAWARVREERQPCGRKVSRWVGAGVFTQGRACGSGWRRCRPPAAWASAGLQMCAGSSRPGPHPTHRGALSKAAARRPGRLPGSSLLALRPTRLLQPGPKPAAPLRTDGAPTCLGGGGRWGESRAVGWAPASGAGGPLHSLVGWGWRGCYSFLAPGNTKTYSQKVNK